MKSAVFSRALAAALGALSLVGLPARPARAFCRTISQLTPAGYDPTVSGCFTGGSNAYPVYWKNLCISYSLQKDASAQVSLTDAKNVAAKAFATWSQATCSNGLPPTIMATELEPPGQAGVDCGEVQYNPYGPNQNVIVFRDDGWPDPGDSTNTLGLTTVTYDTTDGEIYDADMEINTHDFQIVAYPPAPPNGFDLVAIMTHEAGHFLGLAHSADANAIMYAFYHSGEMLLEQDDIDGICSIDVPDGTRTTFDGPVVADACCDIPRHGLASSCAPEDANGNVVAPASDMPESPTIAACAATTASAPAAPGASSKSSGGCAVAPAPGPAATAWAFAFAAVGLGALCRRWRKRHLKDACDSVARASI